MILLVPVVGGSCITRTYRGRHFGPKPRVGEAFPLVGRDAGHLSAIGNGFDFESPEIAAGLGIRIDLPVGPIRLEYGHNLTQDLGEPSGTWHFAIGAAF